ncbi:MAG: rod shape-determining protein RodA [Candidatus Kerfeldbacteria bacterium]|nr:rod shape-determining protein RodA [Candidatus Kerfeldbacteria bacterium]
MATLSGRQIIKGFDLAFMTMTAVLLLIGLAALYSFALHVAKPDYSFLLKQTAFAAAGFAAVGLLMRFDYRRLAGIHWLLYGIAVASLVVVLMFGRTVHGTTGWFVLGGLQLQPVEFVKIIMTIVLAKFFSDHGHELHRFSIVAASGLLTAVPVGLVMLQPDLGSAVVIVGIWIGLLIILPIPKKFLGAIVAGLIVTAVIGWFGFLHPYQKDRLLNFFNPGRDPLGSGYNVRQAVTAIGSGLLSGRGLGLGPQSQLNFVPERQTDFIFATIGEELGFIGATIVIVAFGIFFWRLRQLLAKTRDSFSFLLGVSLGMMLFIQVAINIGMNLGLFPVTGIPLPFLSYGGSSLIASFLAVGLLESMVIRQRFTPL